MTAVATPAGAPCYEAEKVNRNVSRLLARIVKVIEEERWHNAQALQRLSTHSFCGKALVVRRVSEQSSLFYRRVLPSSIHL
jgi:hypothetical protein